MVACNKCSIEARKVLGGRAQAYHRNVNDVKRCAAGRAIKTTVKVHTPKAKA